MANALRVNAAEVLRRPGTEKRFDLRVPLADLEIIGDERFPEGADVEVHLRLESLSDAIVVDGRLLVPWHGTCRRCLVETGGILECEVRELYQWLEIEFGPLKLSERFVRPLGESKRQRLQAFVSDVLAALEVQ